MVGNGNLLTTTRNRQIMRVLGATSATQTTDVRTLLGLLLPVSAAASRAEAEPAAEGAAVEGANFVDFVVVSGKLIMFCQSYSRCRH